MPKNLPPTVYNGSLFVKETCQYLDQSDLKKLICLNRKHTEVFLKFNSRLFVRMFNARCADLLLSIRDLSYQCDVQQKQITKVEKKDRVRLMMANEIGQETLRYLVEKYISKPALKEKDYELDREVFEESDEGMALKQCDKAMEQIQGFITGFMDEARKTAIRA